MGDARLFANAAKAFIVNADNQVLILKRRLTDVHRPGRWDMPGGRLGPGEDPYAGVERETREEAGIAVDVEQVLQVHHFTRDDGQVITMLIFLCRPRSLEVRLSEEHTEYRWVSPEAAAALEAHWLPDVVDRYRRWTIATETTSKTAA